VKNRGQEEEEEAVGNDKAYPKGYSESNRVGIRPKGNVYEVDTHIYISRRV